MGLKEKYCFCYPWDYGVVILGFLQLNAALFFWARFAQMEPVYAWFDLGIAGCYTARATYFFLMLAMDSDSDSRISYFEAHKWSTFPLTAIAIAIITCKWIEWSYPPTWIIISWALCGGMNAYHWFALKAYAEIEGSSFQKFMAQDAKVKQTENINMVAIDNLLNHVNNNKIE